MDVGEYDTNTLLISNLSSIAYRIYEPIVPLSSAYTFPASDVEDALRKDGHLVYMDAVRRGYWCFYLARKDGPRSPPEQHGLFPTLEVCGFRLALVDEGSFEPANLSKSRPPGSNAINTPNSSSSSGSALEATARTTQGFNMPGSVSSGIGMDLDTKIAVGQLSDSKGYSTLPVKEVHEFFITAVLSSLTNHFCRQVGAISLNYRNVLLPPSLFQPDTANSVACPRKSSLATFRVYVTTTGSLVITLFITVLEALVPSADALSLNSMPIGTSLLAAPFGAFALFQGVQNGDSHVADHSGGQSPDTELSRPRLELVENLSDKLYQWKNTCAKLIQMRGIPATLLDGCPWLSVQFLQRKPYEPRPEGKRTPIMGDGPTAPWPSVLCFRKLWTGFSPDRPLLTGPDMSLDPLGSAHTWFQSSAERDEQLVRREKDREATTNRETSELEIRPNPTNGYSPLALHRPANAGATAAAGAMYPTPPDGVQLPGLTPSFDGAGSSPANLQIAATVVDPDVVMTHDPPAAEPPTSGWGSTEPKREPQNPNFLEGENLFGDLGEDMFENNELTDADFNFFDERPDVGVGDLDMSVLQDLGPTLDLAAGMSLVSQGSAPKLAGPPEVPVMERAMPGVFTKPELKHARSSLAEEMRQQNNMDNRNFNAGSVKRHPSPFNPDTVYKRIRATIGRPSPRALGQKNAPLRRRSVFEKVDFDSFLSLNAKKYQENGRFQYSLPSDREKENGGLGDGGLLSTRGPKRIAKKRKPLKDLPLPLGALLKASGQGDLGSPRRFAPVGGEGGTPDIDDISLESDPDEDSDTTEEALSPVKSSVFDRRGDEDGASIAFSAKDLESSAAADSPGYANIDLSGLWHTPELIFSRYFADPEPAPLRVACTDDDFILIAQIVAEQAVSGTLRFGPGSTAPEPDLLELRREAVGAIRHSIQILQSSLPRSLAGATDCQFRPFLEVQDIPHLGQPSRLQPRPAGQELIRPNLFHIPPPHVEMRRHENRLSLRTPALAFWESLGLGPSMGSKDVVAICAFPAYEGLEHHAGAFLDRIQSSYESLKLGTFERLATYTDLPDGLIACPPEQNSPLADPDFARFGSSFPESMARLSDAMALTACSQKNFVVFFVYLPDNPSSVVDACAAFRELFEKYKTDMEDRKKLITNELVLQLVPLDCVATETSLVVLSPADYTRLAVETYDRCTLFEGPMPAPAIVLEPALPRMIEFKLTSIPSQNLLQENSCIHVAYCQSVDERWVTVAWTDNRGRRQMTASYCLGRRGKALATPLTDIFHEIWDTTQDLVSNWKVHWRVIIAKCGPMETSEAEVWEQLAKASPAVNLLLLTVDSNPSLQLIPPAVKLPETALSALYTTPVSTPQPFSVLSPEQSNNPSTPAGSSNAMVTTPGGGETEPDVDTTLADVTDATWGAIVSHRLNNSWSLTELNPALASGYLVKRGGIKVDDPPAVLEVNIIRSEGSPRLLEALLREMLTYFRSLGTLARARGLVDPDTDVRPWHVAAAEKAVRALYQLM